MLNQLMAVKKEARKKRKEIMVYKTRIGLGFFGLCVVLALSLGTALQKAAAATGDCCEFASPQGCASAPGDECSSSACVAAGGTFVADSECNVATGNCEGKAGNTQRVCCVNMDEESGAQCANATDDDGDGKVNDGCPADGAAESGANCNNATDDDSDTKVNDGCPAIGCTVAAGGMMDMGACAGLMIPTVSQWGLAVMVILVLTAGTIVVMRRRAAVA